VRLVEPKIVQEVAFDTVQPRARHNSGYALRFPRIVRLLDDKPVQEIDTLETVRRLDSAPICPIVLSILPCAACHFDAMNRVLA
jgi:hypothetical protein